MYKMSEGVSGGKHNSVDLIKFYSIHGARLASQTRLRSSSFAIQTNIQDYFEKIANGMRAKF